MLDQAIFHLTRANAVARRFEHVVRAALVPKIAFLIGQGQVARSAPTLALGAHGGFFLGRRRVVPVANEENRIGMPMHIQMIDRHLADFARFANPAGFVNHRDLMARIGFAHAAGLGRPESVAVAHDVVDLGLAKHFIDLHAQLLITPQIHRITHGLARAHERFKLEFERFPRLGKRLHHRFERGGKEKRVRDPMGLQNIKGQLRRETAIACNDFPPEIQAGQQRVHQAARPSPVCGAPEYRFGGSIGLAVKAKPVLARHKTRQIPQQGAVRNQGAFGRARGAAGVDQNGGIVGTGLHQRKLC